MCEEVQRFEDLLMQQREFFAEEEISQSFPRLIAFVAQVRQEEELERSARYIKCDKF